MLVNAKKTVCQKCIVIVIRHQLLSMTLAMKKMLYAACKLPQMQELEIVMCNNTSTQLTL